MLTAWDYLCALNSIKNNCVLSFSDEQYDEYDKNDNTISLANFSPPISNNRIRDQEEEKIVKEKWLNLSESSKKFIFVLLILPPEIRRCFLAHGGVGTDTKKHLLKWIKMEEMEVNKVQLELSDYVKDDFVIPDTRSNLWLEY